jgi:hypothetical protein
MLKRHVIVPNPHVTSAVGTIFQSTLYEIQIPALSLSPLTDLLTTSYVSGTVINPIVTKRHCLLPNPTRLPQPRFSSNVFAMHATYPPNLNLLCWLSTCSSRVAVRVRFIIPINCMATYCSLEWQVTDEVTTLVASFRGVAGLRTGHNEPRMFRH